MSLAGSVGKEIKNLRTALKMTAHSLADKAGLSKGMLSKIERGSATPSFTTTPGPGFQHPGIEFMYMLQGSMQYRYADTLVELYPGDTLVFDSNAIHGHERLIETPVRFVSVVITNRA